MAKKTSEKKTSFEIGKGQTVTLERITVNMGRRRETFYLRVRNRFFEYKIPNITLEELERIVEEAKKLRED